MSANADIVRASYDDGVRRWDSATLDDYQQHLWHPEITWRAIEGAPDDVGLIEGADRLRRYYEEWLEVFDEMSIELTDLAEGGRPDRGGHVCPRAQQQRGDAAGPARLRDRLRAS